MSAELLFNLKCFFMSLIVYNICITYKATASGIGLESQLLTLEKWNRTIKYIILYNIKACLTWQNIPSVSTKISTWKCLPQNARYSGIKGIFQDSNIERKYTEGGQKEKYSGNVCAYRDVIKNAKAHLELNQVRNVKCKQGFQKYLSTPGLP